MADFAQVSTVLEKHMCDILHYAMNPSELTNA